jgi:hypothetical protein
VPFSAGHDCGVVALAQKSCHSSTYKNERAASFSPENGEVSMAFNPKISANLIPVSRLPETVAKAVELAQARVGAVDGVNLHFHKWDLVGRIARDFAGANKFADAVTAEIAGMGIKAEPAVFKVGGAILAGYIERDNLPQIRGF